MSLTMIDSQGRLALPQPAVREIGSRPVELVSRSSRHLLLTVPEEGSSVVLAGVLAQIPVADLLSFFNMFRKTGILRFELAGGSKDLYFQQGEIVFATSTFPEEEIGEILFALGKVSREVLQKTRPFVTPRTTMGKLLVEKGVVVAKDLWLATRQQVETIVYHLFSYHQGSFSFLAKDLEKEEILRLSMSTQNLVMEGLRRVDERTLFMHRIRSLDALPVLTGKPIEEADEVPPEMLALLREGKSSAREVVRRSGLGEFDGLRLLYQLAEKGAVTIEEAPSVAVDGELGEILAVFNGAMGVLYRRITARNPQFRQDLQFFLRDLPQPFSYVFRDVELREDGTVDGGRILANLAGLEEGDKKKLLADGLSELIYMECHAARKELGTAESAELIQRVQEVSRRVKALTGRNE